ncbi:MAG: hypothetical protein KDE20_10980 [Caldilineaceae bacterium]|nr:hypothetical protein [Caldilineaceae bacterium]
MAAGDFVFDLATPADDAAIRALLAANPVPGDVTLAYLREPDYFLGCPVMGATQVLVARHLPTGQIAGIATRSVRTLFVNGEPVRVGYIGQLRVDHRFRGRWLVAPGFRFCHALNQADPAAGYITTIIEGNTEAEGLLVTRARGHIPAYREVGKLVTLAIVLHRRRWWARRPAGLSIERGSHAALDEIVAFLQREGRRKQFTPRFDEVDFADVTTRGFTPDDFLVARTSHGALCGVLGLWDQTSFKQTVVTGYVDRIARLRGVYNLGARIPARPALPHPGAAFHSIYAAFIAVADDDPEVFRALLEAAFRRAAARGFAFLTVGLSPRDPLFPVAARFAHIPYTSTIYTVGWPENAAFHDQLDGRVPYLELATL